MSNNQHDQTMNDLAVTSHAETAQGDALKAYILRPITVSAWIGLAVLVFLGIMMGLTVRMLQTQSEVRELVLKNREIILERFSGDIEKTVRIEEQVKETQKRLDQIEMQLEMKAQKDESGTDHPQ